MKHNISDTSRNPSIPATCFTSLFSNSVLQTLIFLLNFGWTCSFSLLFVHGADFLGRLCLFLATRLQDIFYHFLLADQFHSSQTDDVKSCWQMYHLVKCQSSNREETQLLNITIKTGELPLVFI